MKRSNTLWRKPSTDAPRVGAQRRFPARVLLLSMLLSAACVTQGTYEELLMDRDATAQRESSLRAEVAQLEQRIDLLETTSESLSSERIQLIDEMETLSLEREVMIASLKSLQEAREQLSGELSSRTSELDRRNQELQALTGTYEGLVEDLESEVSSGRIQIEQLKEGVRLNLPQEVLFPLGSSKLAPEGEAVLHKVASSINTDEYRVEVQGHTDNLGIHGALAKRYPTNWELAGARAARVVRLLEEGGVRPDRLTAVSMGSHQPVASNESEEGRALNRRIEIRLLRITGPKGKAPDEVPGEAPEEAQVEDPSASEGAAEKNQEKAVEAPAVAE